MRDIDLQKRAQALTSCRRAVHTARRYAERIQAQSTDGIHSPAFDRVRTGNISGGAADRVVMIDYLHQREAEARSEAEKAQRRARRWLHGLPEAMADFAEAYFVLGLDLDSSGKYADRSRKQCERYRHALLRF